MNKKKPIIDQWGNKHWYNDLGQYHREDGPAYESHDELFAAWCFNGKYHREDGPA